MCVFVVGKLPPIFTSFLRHLIVGIKLLVLILSYLLSQKIPMRELRASEKMDIVELAVTMQAGVCPYIVGFYGCLIRDVSLIGVYDNCSILKADTSITYLTSKTRVVCHLLCGYIRWFYFWKSRPRQTDREV